MVRILFTLVFLCTGVSLMQAQNTCYTIQLKDKNGSIFSIARPAEFLSARAIDRRNKQHIPMDSTDLPVSQVYVDSIAHISGVTVVSTSKWLNNVLVEAPDSITVSHLQSLPFVKHLTPVGLFRAPRATPISKTMVSGERPVDQSSFATTSFRTFASGAVLADSINYGANYPQVHLHEGEYLHKMGFLGNGIIIAVLDAGFRDYQTNIAFDSLRANNQILGEYDFVHNAEDVNIYDAHGANCLSIIAANMPGQMVGTAPKASFYLFKTEESASEKPVEEQNWVVAAERADSAGADMISSSLGYSNFDDTTLSLTYPLRDGKTAPVTIGANMAVQKGMIVTCSSGNSGTLTTDYKYVMCPADGDDVLAIGATNTNGLIATFSSGGPNGAGKLKPNVVSVGYNTVFTNTSGVVSTGSGTSYSNPNMAGLIACLWGAFPDFNNRDIIDAVQRSADRFLNPDQRYGYGVPNMRIAYQLLDAKRKQRLNLTDNRSFISVYPVPFHQSFTIYLQAPSSGTANLRILDEGGRLMLTKSLPVQQDEYYYINMSPSLSSSGLYYLQYDDGKNRSLIKLARL